MDSPDAYAESRYWRFAVEGGQHHNVGEMLLHTEKEEKVSRYALSDRLSLPKPNKRNFLSRIHEASPDIA
jgi:hypothetical protein